MSQSPTISVVIPAYNLEDYLRDSVASAMAQTHMPVEIIIVDNASRDRTLDVAKELAAGNDIIRVLEESRPGAPFARNCGLHASTGEWVQFLDGDDLLKPEKFAHQVGFITDKAGSVVGPTIEREQNGSEKAIPVSDSAWHGLFFSGGALGYTSSIIWRRSAVLEVGGWDTELRCSQEYDLMFRVLKAGWSTEISSDYLTVRRIRPGQISSGKYGLRVNVYLNKRHDMLLHMYRHGLIRPGMLEPMMQKYFMQYTHLRRYAPRLARRFRKNKLGQLKEAGIVSEYPDFSKRMWRSHLTTLKYACMDLLRGKYKKYLLDENDWG